MHDQAGIGRGLWFGRHTSTVMCALTSCYPTRITNTLNHDLGGDDVLGASGKLGRGIPFTTIWATLFIVRGDEQADDLATAASYLPNGAFTSDVRTHVLLSNSYYQYLKPRSGR